MDDLVVDGKFLALITDDENTDAAATIVKGVGETLEQAALVNDWETLLDIASLGHGNDTAVITDVEDTILLEDWAEHVLNNNGWGGAGDEAGLLM